MGKFRKLIGHSEKARGPLTAKMRETKKRALAHGLLLGSCTQKVHWPVLSMGHMAHGPQEGVSVSLSLSLSHHLRDIKINKKHVCTFHIPV